MLLSMQGSSVSGVQVGLGAAAARFKRVQRLLHGAPAVVKQGAVVLQRCSQATLA